MTDDKFQNQYRIPSIRLKCWDYSSTGYYFITICTLNKEKYFGDIINEKMQLSKIGEIAKQELLKTEKLRKNVKLDEWIVMPNHIHMIIVIDNSNIETQSIASLQQNEEKWEPNKFGPQSNNLASIVRGFKAAVKKWTTMNNVHFEWQSRFYEHIIRNEEDLNKIREYIVYNPVNWLTDEDFV